MQTYHGLAALVLGDLVLGIGVVDFVDDERCIGYLSGHPANVLLLCLGHDNLECVVAARRLLLAVAEAQRQAKVEWVAAQRGPMLVCGGARFPCWNRRACAGHRVEIPPDEADGDEEGDEWNDPRWSAEHLDGYTAAFHRIDGCGEVFETVVRIIAREASGAGVVNVVSSASTYGGASRTQLRVTGEPETHILALNSH